jgi:hypothetical protein
MPAAACTARDRTVTPAATSHAAASAAKLQTHAHRITCQPRGFPRTSLSDQRVAVLSLIDLCPGRHELPTGTLRPGRGGGRAAGPQGTHDTSRARGSDPDVCARRSGRRARTPHRCSLHCRTGRRSQRGRRHWIDRHAAAGRSTWTCDPNAVGRRTERRGCGTSSGRRTSGVHSSVHEQRSLADRPPRWSGVRGRSDPRATLPRALVMDRGHEGLVLRDGRHGCAAFWTSDHRSTCWRHPR